MDENEIARIVIDAALKVHMKLGPGLLESVYEAALAHELTARGLLIQRQVAVPVYYDGVLLDEGFRADIIVEGKVILELKSQEFLSAVHPKQLLTYLRLTGLRLGLLLNFGAPLMKEGITRIVNKL
jgi:GxxExxY protein